MSLCRPVYKPTSYLIKVNFSQNLDGGESCWTVRPFCVCHLYCDPPTPLDLKLFSLLKKLRVFVFSVGTTLSNLLSTPICWCFGETFLRWTHRVFDDLVTRRRHRVSRSSLVLYRTRHCVGQSGHPGTVFLNSISVSDLLIYIFTTWTLWYHKDSCDT